MSAPLSASYKLLVATLVSTGLIAASTHNALAQSNTPLIAGQATPDNSAEISSELSTLKQALDAQNTSLQKQNSLIESQKKQLERQQKQIDTQQEQMQSASQLLKNLQSQIDQLQKDNSGEAESKLSDEDVAMRQRLADLESQVKKIPDDPSQMLADEDFPGAIRIPGTAAAFKISGFVKALSVKNFDPLVTQDRFIVGSIPISSSDETSLASETSLTANQSRVNFDYRQKSDVGNLRAFVEGDFFGDGDTFRLRHAFGQFRDIMAGKTWSAFYDAQAAPEEVDFEGINGHVVLRQTQIRYFPEVGKDLRLMVSLEDPNPQVTGGTGVSDLPDLIVSIRRTWFNRWHAKTALLMRQIGAINNAGADSNGQLCTPIQGTPAGTPDSNGCIAIANAGDSQKETGWALTASGKVQVPWWGENDNLMFQLNAGKGLGRYLTDLASITSLGIDGGQDGYVDPVSGKLDPLPVFGGYAAFQHWWHNNVRSTFIVSMINIDNLASQPNVAYHQTRRFSSNIIWSPIPSVDLGAEFLWGRRYNKGPDPIDGKSKGSATQIQVEAVYRF